MHAPHWVDVDANLDVSALPALEGTRNLQQLPASLISTQEVPLSSLQAGRRASYRPAFQADVKAEGDIIEILANVLPSLACGDATDLVNLRVPSAFQGRL